MARRPVEALYTSDLLRASQTAAPIASTLGVEARPMKELREIFLGDWEGLHSDELAQRFPETWDAWTREPNWDVVPRGEGASPFEKRVVSVLDRLFEQHSQGDAIVVTHGGVIQIALHRVVGRPSHGLFPFRISNASVSSASAFCGTMKNPGLLARARAAIALTNAIISARASGFSLRMSTYSSTLSR